MAYTHTNKKGVTYYCNSKDVNLRGGRMQTIYYFSRDERPTGSDLPAGARVVENERTGLPLVKNLCNFTPSNLR